MQLGAQTGRIHIATIHKNSLSIQLEDSTNGWLQEYVVMQMMI